MISSVAPQYSRLWWAAQLHMQVEEERELNSQLEAALAAEAAFWAVVQVEEEEWWQW